MLGSSSLLRDIDRIDINPVIFRRLVDLANTFDSSAIERVEAVFADTSLLCSVIDEEIMQLSGSFNSLLSEVRQATKRANPFASLLDEDEEDPIGALSHTSGENFLRVVLDILESVQVGYHLILKTSKNIRPVHIELLEDKFKLPKNFEELQMFHLELQMHGPTIGNFTNGILNAYQGPNEIIRLGRLITEKLDRYYQVLNHRHSVEGIEIHQDPIITDVALAIYENVDAHGEIQDGKNPDEISAYTIRKATILAESLRTGLLGSFMREPEKFIDFIQTNLKVLWEASIELNGLVSDFVSRLQEIVNLGRKPAHINEGQFQRALSFINDLNPSNVTYKEKTGLLSLEERHELDFRNSTLRCISIMLTDGAKTTDIIDYILNRKKELREYNLEENSFFVCKIGGGNPFTRESPGELKVVPGIKPTVDLSEVIGSGFKEVVAFMRNILDSAKWFDLFLATSPSKKADKFNALLVGPQGCHRKGQKILMFDGSLRPVEKIKVGDQLMGPDSTSRNVLELHRGSEEMVEIKPTKGDPWVVNKGHILTLVRMGRKKLSGEIRDIAVTDYLSWSAYMKREFKLFRVGVEFTAKSRLPLDPYFLGTLLGDGSIGTCPGLTTGDPELVREVYKQAKKFGLHVTPFPDPTSSVTRYYLSGTCHKPNPIMLILRYLGLGGTSTRNKFIPYCYKTTSRKERLKLLAGLIDTDGSLSSGCYDFQSKSKYLASDVKFVACSLGFAAYQSTFQKEDTKGVLITYYRVKISGNVSLIPVRIPHKKAKTRKQIKNVLRTGLTIRELPPERYYGFTVNGDHRYLLGDFTVTHNSGKTEALRAVASDRNSLGIFAQASDFLTCWKGESEKNPKRLFEAALKLQRESRKQVFILLDEIDTVLNGDRGQLAFGGTNLATEFQVLMDGITSYPHLALWGATNHPERISTPLIRRFSKVIIVGELSQEDRVKLLKQFLGYLPISDQFDDETWNNAAESLNGAVGDIIRKIIDHVWREKMSFFVNNHPDQAEIVLGLLHEGDTKFHPSRFTQAKRLEMHDLLRPFVRVEPVDLSSSIEIHLNNIAIQREIQTAVATYENAKQFLADVVKN